MGEGPAEDRGGRCNLDAKLEALQERRARALREVLVGYQIEFPAEDVEDLFMAMQDAVEPFDAKLRNMLKGRRPSKRTKRGAR